MSTTPEQDGLSEPLTAEERKAVLAAKSMTPLTLLMVVAQIKTEALRTTRPQRERPVYDQAAAQASMGRRAQ